MADKINTENLTASKNINDPVRNTTVNIQNSLFLYPVTESEIGNIISQLNSNSASGEDGISAKFIKYFKNYFIPPLVFIINFSFTSGIFPDDLKYSIVTPVFKAGDKTNVSNYRPISVINQFAKVFEKAIAYRLNKHLSFNNIISCNQYGFRPNKSTDDALFLTMKTIYSALNDNKRCLAIFLDLAKAFDSVPHNILLSKLHKYGVRGIALELFKSYINDRGQAVKIENSMSTRAQIHYGVPQGTVLGPILFLCYINDLLSYDIGGQIVSYADDTVLIFSGINWEEVCEKSERGMHLVKYWLNQHILSLNISKTKFLTFSYNAINQPEFQNIKIHWGCTLGECRCDKLIARAKEVKYLGVLLDGFLRWDRHIELLVKKMRYLLYTFVQVRYIFSRKYLFVIYKALVETVLQYGIVVWGGMYNNLIEPLIILQKLILKILLFKDRQYPTELLYIDANVLDLRGLYILKCLKFAYKNPSLKPPISHRLATRSRSQNAVDVPRASRAKNQRFITYLAPLFFNHLPYELRQINNFSLFVRRVSEFLLENRNLFVEVISALW